MIFEGRNSSIFMFTYAEIVKYCFKCCSYCEGIFSIPSLTHKRRCLIVLLSLSTKSIADDYLLELGLNLYYFKYKSFLLSCL